LVERIRGGKGGQCSLLLLLLLLLLLPPPPLLLLTLHPDLVPVSCNTASVNVGIISAINGPPATMKYSQIKSWKGWREEGRGGEGRIYFTVRRREVGRKD